MEEMLKTIDITGNWIFISEPLWETEPKTDKICTSQLGLIICCFFFIDIYNSYKESLQNGANE